MTTIRNETPKNFNDRNDCRLLLDGSRLRDVAACFEIMLYELTVLNAETHPEHALLYNLNASTCTTPTQGASKPLLTHRCAVWRMCDRGFLGIHTLEGRCAAHVRVRWTSAP